MKKPLSAFLLVFATSTFGQIAVADNDFHGIIESRPEGKVGTWIVGGRSFEVTQRTDLDEDHGPLEVGACAEVDVDNGTVDEIESEPARKCRR